jgi:hypothetical protein
MPISKAGERVLKTPTAGVIVTRRVDTLLLNVKNALEILSRSSSKQMKVVRFVFVFGLG